MIKNNFIFYILKTTCYNKNLFLADENNLMVYALTKAEVEGSSHPSAPNFVV